MVPIIDKAKSIRKGFICRNILFPMVGSLLLATQTGCSQHRSSLGIGMGAKLVTLFRNNTSDSTQKTNNSPKKEEPLGSSRDEQNGFVLNIDKQVQYLKDVKATLILLYRSKSGTENKEGYVKSAIDNLDCAIENYDTLKFLTGHLYKKFESKLDLSPGTPQKNNSIESKKQLEDRNYGENGAEVTICQQLRILDGIKKDLLLFSKSELGMDDMVNIIVGPITHSMDQAWRDVSQLFRLEISPNDGMRKGSPEMNNNNFLRNTYIPLLSSIAEEDNDQSQADVYFKEILEDLENFLFELNECECGVVIAPQGANASSNTRSLNQAAPPGFVRGDFVEASGLEGKIKVDNALVHQDNSRLGLQEFQEACNALANPPKHDQTKSTIQGGLNCCKSKQGKEKVSSLSSKELGKKFISLCKYRYKLEKRIKSGKASESELGRLRKTKEDLEQSIKEVSGLLCSVLTSNGQEKKNSDASSMAVHISHSNAAAAFVPLEGAAQVTNSTSMDQPNQVVRRLSNQSKEKSARRKAGTFDGYDWELEQHPS